MNSTRRSFLKRFGLAAGALGLGPALARLDASAPTRRKARASSASPVMVSTWNHGLEANAAGFEALALGGSALDMIEAGAKKVEADPLGTSVGIGGMPDRDGNVTLDACVMDHLGRAGSVCFVQGVLHPLSLARRVMEDTPHVILAGAGAERFARECGMPVVDLLTPSSKKAWEEWRTTSDYRPVINIENHDTIGLLALDKEGRLAGGCTTSGLAFKMHGRVGDSPIIGAGLFVDPEVGGATATGLGEAVLRTVGSFLVVELMRQGADPEEACREAVKRIIDRMPVADLQVGYLALDPEGRVAGHAIHPGFNYAYTTQAASRLIDAGHG
jgi:isoaspartyl peptidase/L-asparaginase-like protein (Ntn-hydrolase superfamily)